MICEYLAELERERLERQQYTLGKYVAQRCPNCDRQRLCVCLNGKHVCEKCHWCVEDGEYRDA